MSRASSMLFNALRRAFRALPLSDAMRDGWRQRFLQRFPTIRPDLPKGRAGPAQDLFRSTSSSDQKAVGYVADECPAAAAATDTARLIAFYLPQFHAIPENDAWWGKGFTEWRNVTRALPQFEGQVQPRLPGELGFYDLRQPHVMREQARLATNAGLSGFCFYFYWFAGKTLLEEPLRQWLQDDSIQLPFCLCWANENWSRRWDGREDQLLMQQRHSPDDDLAFIAHVGDYLRDPRYLRVDGKPLLLVYRPGLLPAPADTARRWRDWCRDNGIGEIHLAYTQSFERPRPSDIGFDAAVEFPPNLTSPQNITATQRLLNPDYTGEILDWRGMASEYAKRAAVDYPLYPGVNCGWDNEARRSGRGRSFVHASPRGYRDWLRDTIRNRLSGLPATRRLVFINAWNEWAEGAILEPDARLGHAWLQATRTALRDAAPSPREPAARPPCAVVHAWYLQALPEILIALRDSGIAFRIIVTTSGDRRDAVQAMAAEHGVAAEVVAMPNEGRDILPFLEVANRLLDEGEEIVLKLHTKRSTHLDGTDGDSWRADLLDGLLGSQRATEAVRAFAQASDLGLLAADGHLLPIDDFIGGNRNRLDSLVRRTGVQLPEHPKFAAGSMFWVRLEALRPLLDLHPGRDEFELEAGQIDGTMAHAVERFIGMAVEGAGYRGDEIKRIEAHGCNPQKATYPFAKKNR